MSTGTAIFLIFLTLLIGAVAIWIYLARRPRQAAPAPQESYTAEPQELYTPAAPTVSQRPAYYAQAQPIVVDQRPVIVETYSNPTADLANLIIAEEIISEMREERREERFEEMREEHHEEPTHYEAPTYEEPARYEAPASYEAPVSYESPDTGFGGGDFGSGDAGSF